MSHGHDHGHAPAGGAGQPADHRRRLAIAFGLTTTVLVAQAVGALVTGSLALLVDTAHMLTDAAGLAMALVAAHLSLKPATSRWTWGYRRAEVLGALAQSAVLLAVGGYVLVEGVRRLVEPPEVPSTELIVFGVIHAWFYGAQGTLYASLFPTRVRYTGLSTVYQLSGVYSSGLTPLILTALIAAGHGKPWLACGFVYCCDRMKATNLNLSNCQRMLIGNI